MHLDPTSIVWLNRAGIILNFLAGFMLAPDLIGLARLTKFEAALERVLQFLKSVIGRIMTNRFVLRFTPIKRTDSIPFRVFLSIILLLGWTLPYALDQDIAQAVASIVVLICLLLVLTYGPKEPKSEKPWKEDMDRFATREHDGLRQFPWIIRLLLAPVNFVFSIVASFISSFVSMWFLLPLALVSASDAAIGLAIRSLAGESRLSSGLVWWGIIFFILGNFLQLLATLS